MQNKGAIRLLAIAFALVCLYQLSFTLVTSRVEKKAREFAKGDPKKEFEYLNEKSGEVVYNILVKKYTYNECKEREINLGLDLKGGMDVTLEVKVVDIVKSLAKNNSSDPIFVKAINNAIELQKTSGNDFVTDFGSAFKQLDASDKGLANIYDSKELSDRIKPDSKNDEVLRVLAKEVDDAIENSFNILRSRIDKFGVVQPNIQKLATKGRIAVQLPGIKEPERVRKLLQGTANLEFWETYENKEIYSDLLKADQVLKEYLAAEKAKSDTLAPKKDTIQNVVADVKSDTVKSLTELSKQKSALTQKADSIAALQQMKDANPLLSLLNFNVYMNPETNQQDLAPGSVVGLALVKDTGKINRFLKIRQVRNVFKSDVRFFWAMKTKDGDKTKTIIELHAIKAKKNNGQPVLDGKVITNARPEYQQGSSNASVSMSMNNEGSQKWAGITRDNIKRCIAIVLDGYVASSPTVQNEIAGGNSQITGNFDINEATDLAIILKSGKMPARAEIIQEAIVGPSLGEASVKAGFVSFVIAFLVVLIYMIFYYNKGGWVANIALIVNVFFIFGVLASLNAVLTLPGIAGIVLTLGMAVDANVIIYERIREELRAGKGLRAAVTDGYRHAYSAIIDGNVTTFLTGVVLFIFGQGPIQGFATTLMIGILTSLFTAIFISRLIFEGMLARNKEITFSNSITENILVHSNFDFIGKRKIFYVVSSIIILAGVVSMFTRGFNLGIDFSGGRTFVVKFDKPVNTNEIRNSLAVAFDGTPSDVKTYGGDNQVKIATKYLFNEANQSDTISDKIVENKLFEGLKPFIGNKTFEQFMKDNRQSSEKVGPVVASDIKQAAVLSVIFALIIIFLYIFMRFKNWQFGLGGLISLAHDTLFVMGIYSLLWGYLPFSLEIDQSFIAAILTVIGYSINDSVIIFDRIREYTHLYPKRTRYEVYNAAMNSTLGRTLNTSLTTLFTVIVIFIFGGEVIRGFVFALMIGIGVGTYSSICNAAPIVYDALLAKEKKEKKS